MKIIKPPRLKKGDKLGIISPSYPKPDRSDPEYFQQYDIAVNTIREMGFEVIEGKNLGKTRWWSGGTPEERAEDINAFFLDENIRGLIAHDGGSGAIEILEKLDYEGIKKHPKPLIGFSDITNLHLAIYTKTGLIGFQGPLSTYNFGKYSLLLNKDEQALEKNAFFKSLTEPQYKHDFVPNNSWQWWRKGKASGRLFGGNLSFIDSLIGTPYFPIIKDLSGSILFWEVDNVPLYRIQRSLYHLKYAGIFNAINGMVIGRLPGLKPYEVGGVTEPTVRELVMEIIAGYTFPVLSGPDFGHEGVNYPMPIGVKASLDYSQNHFGMLEGVVS